MRFYVAKKTLHLPSQGRQLFQFICQRFWFELDFIDLEVIFMLTSEPKGSVHGGAILLQLKICHPLITLEVVSETVFFIKKVGCNKSDESSKQETLFISCLPP